MIIGFVIWTICAGIFLAIGISAWKSKKPVGFFTGQKPPEVDDVEKYNHAVAVLWFVGAGVFEALGLPLLFLEQNSIGFVPVILCVPVMLIAMMIAYVRIEARYRK